jgi:hypothetical protein
MMTMIMWTDEETIEYNKTQARFILVNSAKIAVMDEIDSNTWITSDEVKKYIEKYNLHKDIAIHIAAMVWNPTRRDK